MAPVQLVRRHEKSYSDLTSTLVSSSLRSIATTPNIHLTGITASLNTKGMVRKRLRFGEFQLRFTQLLKYGE